MSKPFIHNVYGMTPTKSKVTLFTCIASICLLIALVGCIAGTLCALTDEQKHVSYDSYLDGVLIKTDHVVGETEVYPGYSESTSAIAKNNGTLPMWARMQYNKYWVEQQGDTWVKSADTSLNVDYIEVEIDNSSDWVDGGDGWYYYMQEIAPGAQSTSFLKTVGFSTEIGEPTNDANNHAISSEYVGKAAQVDVDLQCVAKPPETVEETTEQTTSSDDEKAADSTNAEQPKSYFLSDTSDNISLLVYALFALSLAALIASLCFFIIARKKHKKEEQDLGFDVIV